jgi:chromosomal replication initiation ATPase DnaA
MHEEQLSLPLPPSLKYQEEDFVVTESNRDAFKWISSWPKWQTSGLVVWGPKGSGKSHLGRIWQHKSNAKYKYAREITFDSVESLVLDAPSLVIDEFFFLSSQQLEAFFHLYNALKRNGRFLLILAEAPPASWAIALPDLKSRFLAMGAVEIKAPDDALLKAVLLKGFSDHQIVVDLKVIEYLSHHIYRSFEAAQGWVDFLNKEALAKRRKITIPFIKEVQESFQVSPF